MVRTRVILSIGKDIVMRDCCNSHFKTYKKILQACCLLVGGEALDVSKYTYIDGNSEQNALPKGKENDCFDTEKLFKWAEGEKKLMGSMIEKNEAVQSARDGYIVKNGEEN